MFSLAPADIVKIWELGHRRPDWHRALLILAPALPDMKPSELAALSIGRRNAYLFALRQRVIGPLIHALVKCPICREPLEFEQRIAELLDDYQPPDRSEFCLASGEFTIKYRLLTSEDLARGATGQDLLHAKQILIECASLEVTCGGATVAPSDLPVAAVEALAADLLIRDPLANVGIPLACAACQHVWSVSLDIFTFFWTELEAEAKRLLADVVTLARGYGWSEADILTMSSVRRQFYLGAVE